MKKYCTRCGEIYNKKDTHKCNTYVLMYLQEKRDIKSACKAIREGYEKRLEKEIDNWTDWKKNISKDIYGVDFNIKDKVKCAWCGEIYKVNEFCCPKCQQQDTETDREFMERNGISIRGIFGK